MIGKFFNWLFESERRGEMSEDVELQTDAAKKTCREVVVDILIEVYSDSGYVENHEHLVPRRWIKNIYPKYQALMAKYKESTNQ